MDEENKDLDKRISDINQKIDKLTKDYYEGPQTVWDQFRLSPKAVLSFITLLNVGIFIGGTVYTGIQVSSIQERYEEASLKISEAKYKYEEAGLKLKSIQSISNNAKSEISSIQKQAIEVFENLEKRSTESSEAIKNIKAQSQNELESLKISSAGIIESMNAYKNNTEAALEKAASEVGQKLEREIKFNKKAIEEKQTSIDELGLQIEGLSLKVEAKKLELEKIQNGLEEQLAEANGLNNRFLQKIKAIAGTEIITVPIAVSITDIWMKIIFSFLVIISILALILSLRR